MKSKGMANQSLNTLKKDNAPLFQTSLQKHDQGSKPKKDEEQSMVSNKQQGADDEQDNREQKPRLRKRRNETAKLEIKPPSTSKVEFQVTRETRRMKRESLVGEDSSQKPS